MNQNTESNTSSTTSNDFVPDENAIPLAVGFAKFLGLVKNHKYEKDWSIPNFRGDGYDNDRIKKARDKRERRAARNLKNQT